MRDVGEQSVTEPSVTGTTHESAMVSGRAGADTRFDHAAWERTMRHQRVANRLLGVILLAIVVRMATGGAASGVVLLAVVFAVLFLVSLLITRFGRLAEPPGGGPGSHS